jgi:mannosylglycerate hydrolase
MGGSIMKDKQLTVCIVSHTHWDREWYLPFQTFRLMLRDTVGQVLDLLEADGAFKRFVLDGQAIVLEDVLQLEPAWKERIEAHVASGKLAIGPWYILPDEFLVSPESTVRNLLLGGRECARFGGAAKAGYLPDTFGHIEQMPQILKRAGIDSFIYTRGSGNEITELGSEWIWRAPDGSEVLAINQEGGYCNGSALGFEEIWEIHVGRECKPELAVAQFEERVARIAGVSRASVVLFNNGCDHHPPQPKFGEILELIQSRHPEWELRHVSHEEYLDLLRTDLPELKSHTGELLGGKQAHLLTGVWSARMPLKQANARAQMLLEKVLEPLAVFAYHNWQTRLPEELSRNAWKLLMENHPHDSICGCSTDEVHSEMETRFTSLFQICDESIRRVTKPATPVFAADKADDLRTVIHVHNSLPFARTVTVERWVILMPGTPAVEELQLKDDAGNLIPFDMIERHWLERFWGIDYRAQLWTEEQDSRINDYLRDFKQRIVKEEGAEGLVDQFVLLRFQLELDGLSSRRLRLDSFQEEAPAGNAVDSAVISADGSLLENEFLRVRLHPNGTFDLFDKETGREFKELGLLVDEEDRGDEYDWSHMDKPDQRSSHELKGLIFADRASPTEGRLQWKAEWQLPAVISLDRQSRSKELATCTLQLELRLARGSRQLGIYLDVDNQAKDHRLRMHFPTGLLSSKLVSHGHFRVHERGLDQPDSAGWSQPPLGTKPQQDWSAIEDGEYGLALFNHGLPEIEPIAASDGRLTMALTLFRSVGWLSRDDFATRNNCNAGPTLATPAAQLISPLHFEMALFPYAPNWQLAEVQRESQSWRVPAILRQGVLAGSKGDTQSLISQDNPALVDVSAIKLHEDRDTLVLRLVNLTEHEVVETLNFSSEISAAWNVNLLEERLGDCDHGRNKLELVLAPCEIRTVEVELR